MNEWWKNATIYQIYPRSYLDTSNNGVGDLKGITKKINYISSLGIDAIWLSPFFMSPMKDMGYDVSNYVQVDPLFGDMDDFDELLEEAHKKNIRVIIDQVLSHSSDKHEAFIDSKSSKSSRKSDWYVWADANEDGSPPNNWLSVFGGSAWEWEPLRGQYYLHNFLPSQPDFNFHNEEVQDFLLGEVEFWLKKGVDGFRLDTVNYYFHDQELRNNPKSPLSFKSPPVNPYYMQNQLFAINQDENLVFLNKFRNLLNCYPEKASIGEIGDSHRAIKLMKEYTKKSRIHMAYSFKLLGKEFSAPFFRDTIEEFYNDGSDSWPCWSFSNHDVMRHLSRWDKNESDSFAKLSCALLLSLPGTPCLYQGEELGQVETELEFDELTDPPGIRFWPKNKGRDGCRTPMTWDHQKINAGFSNKSPWLPVKEKQKNRSVSLQENESNSILNFYKQFIFFRKSDPALLAGKHNFLNEHEDLLIFNRENQDTKTLCIFNLSKNAYLIDKGDLSVDSSISSNINIKNDQIEFNRYGFIIISDIRNDIKDLDKILKFKKIL